jgi:hypothetical protein
LSNIAFAKVGLLGLVKNISIGWRVSAFIYFTLLYFTLLAF